MVNFLLTVFEELAKEKALRAAEQAHKESTKSLDKEVQSLRQKLTSYEEQIQNLIEAGKLKEKEAKDKLTKLQSDIAKEKSETESARGKLQAKQAEMETETGKLNKLQSQIEGMMREKNDNQALFKKENMKLKNDLETAKKLKADVEKELSVRSYGCLLDRSIDWLIDWLIDLLPSPFIFTEWSIAFLIEGIEERAGKGQSRGRTISSGDKSDFRAGPSESGWSN